MTIQKSEKNRLMDEARERSICHRNTKFYVLWNPENSFGWIDQSVDKYENQMWICYYENGEAHSKA